MSRHILTAGLLLLLVASALTGGVRLRPLQGGHWTEDKENSLRSVGSNEDVGGHKVGRSRTTKFIGPRYQRAETEAEIDAKSAIKEAFGEIPRCFLFWQSEQTDGHVKIRYFLYRSAKRTFTAYIIKYSGSTAVDHSKLRTGDLEKAYKFFGFTLTPPKLSGTKEPSDGEENGTERSKRSVSEPKPTQPTEGSKRSVAQPKPTQPTEGSKRSVSEPKPTQPTEGSKRSVGQPKPTPTPEVPKWTPTPITSDTTSFYLEIFFRLRITVRGRLIFATTFKSSQSTTHVTVYRYKGEYYYYTFTQSSNNEFTLTDQGTAKSVKDASKITRCDISNDYEEPEINDEERLVYWKSESVDSSVISRFAQIFSRLSIQSYGRIIYYATRVESGITYYFVVIRNSRYYYSYIFTQRSGEDEVLAKNSTGISLDQVTENVGGEISKDFSEPARSSDEDTTIGDQVTTNKWISQTITSSTTSTIESYWSKLSVIVKGTLIYYATWTSSGTYHFTIYRDGTTYYSYKVYQSSKNSYILVGKASGTTAKASAKQLGVELPSTYVEPEPEPSATLTTNWKIFPVTDERRTTLDNLIKKTKNNVPSTELIFYAMKKDTVGVYYMGVYKINTNSYSAWQMYQESNGKVSVKNKGVASTSKNAAKSCFYDLPDKYSQP
jgi:hypothetical protein